MRLTGETGDVAVGSSRGEVGAFTVVVAVPPQHRAAIAFSPALPAGHTRLMQVWPQGTLSKAHVVYETPFWRADGRGPAGIVEHGAVRSGLRAAGDVDALPSVG